VCLCSVCIGQVLFIGRRTAVPDYAFLGGEVRITVAHRGGDRIGSRHSGQGMLPCIICIR
jgi:hypothetical protein